VESCGEEVTGLAPGDRVTVFPLLWCGRCPACEEGKYAQCCDYDYLGSRRDGAFAEFVVAPRRNVIRVPDRVTLEGAAMTEPAAVALHALRRAGGCAAGDAVAIFGAGPIGLLVAQWAKHMGASHVVLFDIVAEKLATARGLGFLLAYDSREREPVETIASLTSGRGAQVAIDAAGVPASLIAACSTAGRGGRVVVLGNPAGDVTFPAPLLSQLMRREVSVVGTWNSEYSETGASDDWRDALEAMAAGTIKTAPLVTHRVPLAGAMETLVMMRDRAGFFSKVMICPGHDGTK
jgi:L-iditol 2-dehydrogenase